MKSFFDAQRIRHTAALTLFVWLMSLGIGVANACLVQQDHGPREYVSQVRFGTVLAALAPHQVEPDHFATSFVHSDENTPSPEKTACLDFCVAQQSTLVKDHQNGLAHLDPFPALFLTGLRVPATDQTSPLEAFEGPTWSEPPVSIRYLRLTI
ncbi:MAG: hypothetical protein ACYC4S_15740 [Rhodoferax sp.]